MWMRAQSHAIETSSACRSNFPLSSGDQTVSITASPQFFFIHSQALILASERQSVVFCNRRKASARRSREKGGHGENRSRSNGPLKGQILPRIKIPTELLCHSKFFPNPS